MKHSWLSMAQKIAYQLVLLLAQGAIAIFVFYLAFGFLLSVAGALLGFMGIPAPSFWLQVMVIGGMLLALVILLAAMAMSSGFRLDGALARSANSFLYWVAEGHLSEAYGLTSTLFQTQMSKLAFLTFAETELPKSYKKAVWSSRSIEANHGTLKGVIHTQTGELWSIEVKLIHESSGWKIDGLQVLPPMRQNASLSMAATPLMPLPTPLAQPAQTDVPTALQEQLLQMMSGDRTAAQRLLTYTRSKYPGRSEEWYWEKMIEDLERDRL